MEKYNNLYGVYKQLLDLQKFKPEELDYSILDKHILLIKAWNRIENSAASVFDLYQQKHVYASFNFHDLFGYDKKKVIDETYMSTKVHPDDILILLENGIKTLKYVYNMPKEDRLNYKFISEYRILNKKNEYTKVIEQHLPLELDKNGNIWLALSLLDISPNQDFSRGVLSQMLNTKSGESFALELEFEDSSASLTKREKQVLILIKKGLLSKEISNQLNISVHTVNTHRQRILSKLKVNNSLEAISMASRIGVI